MSLIETKQKHHTQSDNENDGYNDDNGDHFDEYEDEPYPKPDKYHGVIVKTCPI